MVKTNPQRQNSMAFMRQLASRLFFGASLLSIMVMFVLVLVTSFMIATTTHKTRVQYGRLQVLEREQDDMQANWSRLLLEESTWSSPSRIEMVGLERLNMHVPQTSELEVLSP